MKNKSGFLLVVFFILCAVTIVLFIAVILAYLIQTTVFVGQDDIWASSLASYWEGIIGGIVSGTFAFLGVFYTIRYYKESDAQKVRAANLPFLLVKLGRDNSCELSKGFSLGQTPIDKDNQKELHISIQNIGHGFATISLIHTGFNSDGFEFNRVIPVEGFVYTYFILDKKS